MKRKLLTIILTLLFVGIGAYVYAQVSTDKTFQAPASGPLGQLAALVGELGTRVANLEQRVDALASNLAGGSAGRTETPRQDDEAVIIFGPVTKQLSPRDVMPFEPVKGARWERRIENGIVIYRLVVTAPLEFPGRVVLIVTHADGTKQRHAVFPWVEKLGGGEVLVQPGGTVHFP